MSTGLQQGPEARRSNQALESEAHAEAASEQHPAAPPGSGRHGTDGERGGAWRYGYYKEGGENRRQTGPVEHDGLNE